MSEPVQPSEPPAGESASKRPPAGERWRIAREILAFAVPHWKIFLVAVTFTAIYAGASSLRVFIVGLVVDGVLAPPDVDKDPGRAFVDFQKHLGPYLPSTFPPPPERYRAAKFSVSGYEAIEIVHADRVLHFTGGRLTSQLAVQGGAGEVQRELQHLKVKYDAEDSFAVAIAQLTPDAAVVASRKFESESAILVAYAEGPSDVMAVLWVIGGLAAVLALIIAGSNFMKLYLAQTVVLRTVASIRQRLFQHLSSLSVDYYSRRRSGDLISRLTNDVGTLQYSLRFLFGNLLQQPFLLLGGLIAAFYASWQLTLCVCPFMPLLMLPVLKSGRKVHKHGRGSLSRLGELTDTMGQLLSGIRVVKAFGMEEEQQREFERRNALFIRSSLKMHRAKVTSRSFVEGLYNLMGAVIVVLGGWMLSGGFGLTMGDFAVFLSGLLMMYAPIRAMTKAYNTLQESLAGASRVFEILDEESTVRDADGAQELPILAQSVVFDDVWFRYDEGQAWVLGGVSFEAPAGSTVALVGPTGAGKTTVLDLLARFHEPQKGAIYLDGFDVSSATHSSLLAQVAIVAQDAFLFHTTVGENILHGRPDATQADVEEAARAAQIHDEIMAMPDGYDTVIGERGMTLSGGQRQRVTIARAILKNAPILILDEATSALDTESERKVQEAIEALMAGRTTFVIAHRLSTIRHAEQILVLEAGQVIERGNHAHLLALGGMYARLLQLQASTPAAS